MEASQTWDKGRGAPVNDQFASLNLDLLEATLARKKKKSRRCQQVAQAELRRKTVQYISDPDITAFMNHLGFSLIGDERGTRLCESELVQVS